MKKITLGLAILINLVSFSSQKTLVFNEKNGIYKDYINIIHEKDENYIIMTCAIENSQYSIKVYEDEVMKYTEKKAFTDNEYYVKIANIQNKEFLISTQAQAATDSFGNSLLLANHYKEDNGRKFITCNVNFTKSLDDKYTFNYHDEISYGESILIANEINKLKVKQNKIADKVNFKFFSKYNISNIPHHITFENLEKFINANSQYLK